MNTERIEKLKQQYTGQYVVVNGDRPELVRFHGAVGQVKTVNFDGCALVEFDVDNNRGRYDIELDYLKVVDKPAPKPPPKKAKGAKAKAASRGVQTQRASSGAGVAQRPGAPEEAAQRNPGSPHPASSAPPEASGPSAVQQDLSELERARMEKAQSLEDGADPRRQSTDSARPSTEAAQSEPPPKAGPTPSEPAT